MDSERRGSRKAGFQKGSRRRYEQSEGNRLLFFVTAESGHLVPRVSLTSWPSTHGCSRWLV